MIKPGYQKRFGSTFKVEYPDYPSILQLPDYFRLHQEMGKHDVLELYYPRSSDFLTKTLKTGVPIRVHWSNGSVKGEFIGYVSDATKTTVQNIINPVVVRCVSASYPLKAREPKVWVNKTASEVATDIAKKFNLKANISPSPVRYSQLSLSGHSYWEKLNELADRIGYAVHAVGTELFFHPIDSMINQFVSVIPTMLFADQITSPLTGYESPTLDMFQPTQGDYVEGAANNRTDKTVAGVDPITGKVFSSTSSPKLVGQNVRSKTADSLFSSVETGVVAVSHDFAKAFSEAKAHLARLTIPAKGAGQGDPRIAPRRTIQVQNTGSETDGYWVVKTAEHFVHRDGRYQVEFTCATDGLGANIGTAVRPAHTGTAPTRNLRLPNKTSVSSPKLTSVKPLIKEGNAGFNKTPRRWVGK